MFVDKILPNVPSKQRDELRRSWKVRGYIVKFEDELKPKTEEEIAAELLAADELRVFSIATSEDDKPTVDVDPVVEVKDVDPVVEVKDVDPVVEVKDVESSKEPVIETTTPIGVPEDLKCPHCGSTARSPASYEKNHGDNCYQKKD